MAGEDPIDALRAQVRPFEDAEIALVRAVVSSPPFLSDADEAALRYALNLARTSRVRTPDGEDVDVGPFLAPYRDDLLASAAATLTAPRGFDPADAARLVPNVSAHARAWRARLDQFHRDIDVEPKRIRDFYELRATRIEPVGLVYLAVAGLGETEVHRRRWTGMRAENKVASAAAALELLHLRATRAAAAGRGADPDRILGADNPRQR